MDARLQSNEYPITGPIVQQPFQGGELSVIPGSRDLPRDKTNLSTITSQPSRTSTRHTMGDRDSHRDRDPDDRRDSQISRESSSSGSSILDSPILMDELSGLGGYDVVRIVQQIERDLNAGCGSGNTYQIVSKAGGRLFSAIEDDNCFCRWICGPARMSHLTIYDLNERPVLHLDRSCCRCDCCCCLNSCLCQNSLIIRDARGDILGRIQQKCHVFQLKLHILDAEDNVIMQVFGPCCPCRCCAEMNFDIMNHTGVKEVGYILKRWEAEDVVDFSDVNTDHENIEITKFHAYGDVMKATFLNMEGGKSAVPRATTDPIYKQSG